MFKQIMNRRRQPARILDSQQVAVRPAKPRLALVPVKDEPLPLPPARERFYDSAWFAAVLLLVLALAAVLLMAGFRGWL
jgi:hypothetical protein